MANVQTHSGTYPPKPAPKSSSSNSSTLKTLLKFFFRLFMFFILIILGTGTGAGVGLYYSLSKLPDVGILQYYAPVEATEIYDNNNQILMKLHDEENRKIVPLTYVPEHVQKAVIAVEDSRFFEHQGVDFIGTLRALKANFDKKETVQGGSTLTQQITKNLFLTPERTFQRKLAEAWLSMKIEQRFSKRQILELYLNQVYWGHNAYGIEAAAQTYFGKTVKNLNLSEGAVLGGLLSGPELYSPYRNKENAKARQKMALTRMYESGFITAAQAKEALAVPLKYPGIKDGQMRHPYFTSYVLAMLNKKYGGSELLKGGLKVYTTIDNKLQTYAEKALKEHVASLQNYNVQQGAMVAVQPDTGFVKVMVGGTNWLPKNQFNRAWQAQRQPGSAFKPFVYLTAFSRGWTPGNVEVDEPIQYRFGTMAWRPKNYGGGHSGAMTLQRALEASNNIIAVKLGEKVGNANVIEVAKKMGIDSPLKNVLSLPLGSNEVTPLEMTSAYATMANGGLRFEPTPFLKIVDRFGNVIEDNTHRYPKRVMPSATVNTLVRVLKGIPLRGTAPVANIGVPVAGKTGTAENHRDAWFVGFTPHLAAAVWVGNDTPSPMYGATGGVMCAPLWAKFMTLAHEKLPRRDFKDQAAGFPELYASIGIKAGEKSQAEKKPQFEKLTDENKKKPTTSTREINPADLPVPIEELVPIELPATVTEDMPGVNPTGNQTRNSVPITPQNNTNPTGTQPVTPQNNTPASSAPAVPQTPVTPPKAANELDQLIKELDTMQPPKNE